MSKTFVGDLIHVIIVCFLKDNLKEMNSHNLEKNLRHIIFLLVIFYVFAVDFEPLLFYCIHFAFFKNTHVLYKTPSPIS